MVVPSYVEHVLAALPYSVPGGRAGRIVVDVDMDRLTILVGPNASGKTAVLEALGYALAMHFDAKRSALGIALTTTLRPRSRMPPVFVGRLTLSAGVSIAGFATEVVHPLLLEAENRIREMLRVVLGEASKRVMEVLKRDMDSQVVSELPSLPLKYIGPTARLAGARYLLGLAREFAGRDIDIAANRLYTPSIKPVVTESEVAKEISRMLWYPPKYMRFKILYTLDQEKAITKSVLIENPRGFVIIKRRGKQRVSPELAVFHPGFIYWKGVFERLYAEHIHGGLVNEEKAIEILRRYIDWVKGFELVGTTLHLKSVYGDSVSVYSLSDGHRVAAFITLLYATARSPTLFLIDTPEAFVHPDGLTIVADFIAQLVAGGNQVVVATQSIEFLRELLKSAESSGVLDNTLVQRIALTSDGVVKARGRWGGRTSLRSIEELGADLRR